MIAAPSVKSFPSRLGQLEIRASAKKRALKVSIISQLKASPRLPINSSDFTGGDQSASTILHRVPYDVRLLVYQQLILSVGPVLHINYFTRRKCTPCIITRADYFRRGGPMWYPNEAWGVAHHDCSIEGYRGTDATYLQTIFHLARSCHQIYHELMRVVYSSFTFHIINLYSAHRFLHNTPQQNLDRIRSLRLSWLFTVPISDISDFCFVPTRGSGRRDQVQTYKKIVAQRLQCNEICHRINTIPHLTDLMIFVFQYGTHISKHQVVSLLQNINIQIPPEDFEVEVPWAMMLFNPWREESLLQGEGRTFVIRARTSAEEGYPIGGVFNVDYGQEPRRSLRYLVLSCPYRFPKILIQHEYQKLQRKGWI